MSDRLEILRPILSTFKRRFSVFSLGSGVEKGLEYEIAQEWDCVVICAEKDPIRYVPHGRMIVLRREFTAEDLDLLSKCEHFDVVLAFNVLHWMDRSWLRALRALQQLGSTLLVQTPHPADTEACGDWKREINWNLIGSCEVGSTVQFPGHKSRPIYKQERLDGILTSKSFGAPEEIEATVCAGTIWLHHKHSIAPYIPGLTLSNFQALGGVWPPKEMIVSALKLMKWDGPHRDIQPWNIRIDGREAYLIDPGGSDWPDSDSSNLERVIAEVKGEA